MKLQDVVKEEAELLARYKRLNPIDDKEEREAIIQRLKKLQRLEEDVSSSSTQFQCDYSYPYLFLNWFLLFREPSNIAMDKIKEVLKTILLNILLNIIELNRFGPAADY